MRVGISGALVAAAATVLTLGAAGANGQPIKCGWGRPEFEGLQRLAVTRAQPPDLDATYITPDSTFAVHYDTTGPNSPDLTSTRPDGVPDWIVSVAAALDSSRSLLLDLGYVPALPDGDGIYDVYLQEYGGTVYGETFFGTPAFGEPAVTYIVMDNDFAADENYFTHGLNAARVTSAHEYFHAVQLAYGWRSNDLFLYELASTWFEDIAYPELNDWTFWYPDFGNRPTQALVTSPSRGGGASIAIFGHYLTQNFGIEIMREIWAAFIAQGGQGAIAGALPAGRSLTGVWIDFVARLFANGRGSQHYFYADQAVLARPEKGADRQVLEKITVAFDGLSPGVTAIQALAVEHPTSLQLQVEAAPPEYAAQVALEAQGFSLHSIGFQKWFASGLDQFSEIILVVGGGQDSLLISAALSDVQLAINHVYPNPIRPGAVPALSIEYTLAAGSSAGGQTITFYNLLGQELYRLDIARFGEGQKVTVPLPSFTLDRWPAGIYFMRLTRGGFKSSVRAFTVLR